MWRDKSYTRFNLFSAGVEAVIAIVIGAPWLLWSAGPQ
jgi:hypothetical protein